MEIKELSVGDWVLWMGKKCKVDLPLLNTEYTSPQGGEYIRPIPITPEILEKNGFVKESEVGYERFEWRKNGSVAITLNRDSFSKSATFVLTTFKIGINGWLLKIEHIHQLQHAIRLAGIEKEIEV